MGLTKRNVTPKMLAANRANGRKSSGPVTALGKIQSRRNALKHWGRAETIRDLMPALGEDPAEFDKVRRGLYRSLAPRDDFEVLLVDDMADIHWRLRRMIRAEAAAQATRRREQLALRDEEEAKNNAGRMHDLEPFTISDLGLAGLKDSPPKFARILQILKALQTYVEGIGFAGEYVVYLQTVYGPNNPGLRGRHLILEYKRFCEQESTADAATREANRAAFLQDLAAEIAWFEERAARDREARAELEIPRREAELLNAGRDPAKLVHYHEALEACFERKWKLLERHRRATGRISDVPAEAGKADEAAAVDVSPAVDAGEAPGSFESRVKTGSKPGQNRRNRGSSARKNKKSLRTNPLSAL
jgi:hypothetical protein